MGKLAIIADDLTGALDAAAPFCGVVGGVWVATRPEDFGQALTMEGGVVSVSTRSREISSEDARRRMAQVLADIPAGMQVLKKIDSRMKGNIAAELDAFRGRPMIVSPAIPEFGRVVRDGILTGPGIEMPIDIRGELGALAEGADVPDFTSVDDFLPVLQSAPANAVFVGARGMAQALAKRLGLETQEDVRSIPAPLCIVVGSTDPITLAEIDALKTSGRPYHLVEAPSGVLPVKPDGALGSVTVLQAVPGAARTPLRVAADFAETAKPWMEAARSLLMTGGATAEAMMDRLGVSVLSVEGEVLPGLPLCRSNDKVMITKSGGFGERDTFVQIARMAE